MSELFESHGLLFNPRAVNAISNGRMWGNKPTGGFWASPAASDANWKRWCLSQNFCVEALDVFTRFTLASEAKVCVIDTDEAFRQCLHVFKRSGNVATEFPSFADVMDAIDCLGEAPELYHNMVQVRGRPRGDRLPLIVPLDFEKMLRKGAFDALLVRPRFLSPVHRWEFHSWDCDTLLIANPNVVQNVRYYLYGAKIDLSAVELDRLHHIRENGLLEATSTGSRKLENYLQHCLLLAGAAASRMCLHSLNGDTHER